MKKKVWIAVLSLVLVGALAFGGVGLAKASEEKKAEALARERIPEGAVLTETERDDGAFEFHYYDEAEKASYEVTVNRKSGTVKKVESQLTPAKGTPLSTAELVEWIENQGIWLDKYYPGAQIWNITLGKEDDVVSYEIEFRAADCRGTLRVRSSDLAILETEIIYGTPVVVPSGDDQVQNLIQKGKIQKLILKEYPGAYIGHIELDYDDGTYYYDVDFVHNKVRYEAEYEAKTLELLKVEQEKENWIPRLPEDVSKPSQGNDIQIIDPSKNPQSGTSQNKDGLIGQQKAEEIARTKITWSPIPLTKCELDRDDGRLVYELEFANPVFEYEFEIDAYTGVILHWEREVIDD